MAPSVTDIIDLIQIIAPIDRAEPWDNCGLQVGNPDGQVKKVAVALDPDEQTILSARKEARPISLLPITPLYSSVFLLSMIEPAREGS